MRLSRSAGGRDRPAPRPRCTRAPSAPPTGRRDWESSAAWSRSWPSCRTALDARAHRSWSRRRKQRCLVAAPTLISYLDASSVSSPGWLPATDSRRAVSALAVDGCLLATAEGVAAVQRGVVSGELCLPPAKRGLRSGERLALVTGQR